MDKGVVKAGKDVGNTEDILSFLGLWSQDNLLLLLGLASSRAILEMN